MARPIIRQADALALVGSPRRDLSPIRPRGCSAGLRSRNLNHSIPIFLGTGDLTVLSGIRDVRHPKILTPSGRVMTLRAPNGRMRAVSHQLRRVISLGSFYRWALVILPIAAIGGFVLGWASMSSPWPLIPTLKHLASFPNCDTARALGVAPARRGEPGYWLRHDRDRDGIACEPWHRSRRGY